MKTQTTREDLIQMRGQIDRKITKKELEKDVDDNLVLFRAVYAILDFLIRKTWGL